MRAKVGRGIAILTSVAFLVGLSGGSYWVWRGYRQVPLIGKRWLAERVGGQVFYSGFQSQINLDFDNETIPVSVDYGIDPAIQKWAEDEFKKYTPDYAAFVAMDPDTGRLLALVSYSKVEPEAKNFVIKASFPAASVFKIVTASAAIARNQFTADSEISFQGSNHTLYRRNVLDNRENRWSRKMTLREAFGKSVNTVFGKIGVFHVGAESLNNYAFRFGFNRAIPIDLPLEPGTAHIPSDPFGLAEASSGFTREILMSPVQGALIASVIANNGLMMEPFLIHRIARSTGEVLYQAEPRIVERVMDDRTAGEMRSLMEETVLHGTSRKSFRGFQPDGSDVREIGGKTGTLTGTSPHGKYDWFVGFATNGKKKMAVSVLTVNQNQWRVKSSYLARKLFEEHF